MKSGWQMEWDMQVAYAAPFRSHLSAMSEAFKPMREIMITFSANVEQVTKAFQNIAKQLDKLNTLD